jgi:hypothetical protein
MSKLGTYGYILDQIIQESQDEVTGISTLLRPRAVELLEKELGVLAGEAQFQHMAIKDNNLVQTQIGNSDYELPEAFPENFVKESHYAVRPEDIYACWSIDQNNKQSSLAFLTPGRFHSRNVNDQTDSIPRDYTITTDPTGRKMLTLGPPPDRNDYRVGGVYRPLYWEIKNETDLAPVGADIDVLIYAVLRKHDPNRSDWQNNFRDAFRRVTLKVAQASPTRMRPPTRRRLRQTRY